MSDNLSVLYESFSTFFQKFFKGFLKRKNKVFGTKHKATILIDMDETLVELLPAWSKHYNEAYQDNLTKEHFTQWDTSKVVKPECGAKIYGFLKVNGLFRHLEPCLYAQEFVTRLIQKGYDVVLVSDAPEGHSYTDYLKDPNNVSNPADDKRQRVRDLFPMVPPKQIIFTSEKWRVIGDVLVDDKPETYEVFTKLKRPVILVDQPFNRHIKTKRRALNLLQAEKMIYDMFE